MVEIYAGLALILSLALVFGVILPHRRRKAMRRGPIPMVAFGGAGGIILPPRPARPSPKTASEGAAGVASAPAPQEGVVPAPPPPPAQVVPVEMRALEADRAAAEDRGRVLRMHVAGDRRDAFRDERSATTLRLERPHDGTLQFLPGRLEVTEGREVGQEIKFVRTSGPDGTTITFGRGEGAQYRHVQLHEPTVSRLHAKMTLDGKSWALVNLSATNPVVVNGLALAGNGSTVVLRDGDRIEMGEVVFRFRAK